jgi:hypothetical protein
MDYLHNLVNDHNKGVQEYKSVFNPRCTFAAKIIVGYLVVILSVCLLARFLPLRATRRPNMGSVPHWHGLLKSYAMKTK